jgi:uncharacterized protein (DUF1501 family)
MKTIDLPTAVNAEVQRYYTRRWFFRECGVGLASIALGSLLGPRLAAAPAAEDPLAPKAPHFPGKVKRVIYLFMAGAPSHLELFDNKPELTKWDGKLPPAELLQGYRSAFINPNSALLGPKFKFTRYGKNGIEMSELLPHLGTMADEICVLKAMHTDAFNHAPAQIFMNTGSTQFGRPSIGSWVTYGLGSESRDLPAFVVLSTGTKGTSGGSSNWGPGFLPSIYQGVLLRNTGDPVLYLSNPPGIDVRAQRDTLDVVRELNQKRLGLVGDPEIATRINAMEMAYRMQSSAPELGDLSREPAHVLEAYGATPGKTDFAGACLLARRMVERGVRFVQIFHEAWDQHSQLVEDLKKNCHDTDKPTAALLADLKQRGLLDDTLVIWGGEFGRTPMVQGGNDGRDHHPNCFTTWMAGGGLKKGFSYGESDPFGFNGVRDQVHVHDLNATILHLLGFDHTRLTYRFQGRDFRLTDVHGEVVKAVLA